MKCFHFDFGLFEGTDDERGIILWRKIDQSNEAEGMTLKTYDLPFGMSYIRKWSWTRFIPFSPTFVGIDSLRCINCTDQSIMREKEHRISKHEVEKETENIQDMKL